MDRGYVQVYTGTGKGKTTAALGLCLRALGAGYSVWFAQFLKAGAYSEIAALETLASALERGAGGMADSGPPDAAGRETAGLRGTRRLVVRQFGRGRFIGRSPSAEDLEAARAGFEEARLALASGSYDLVILDEINVAMDRGLVSEGELLALVATRLRSTELVLTGRGASPALLAAADLVTEMREVKHYYAQGVHSREGIER